MKGIAERSLAAVFTKSAVANAHAHRFRHTLAPELLGRGAGPEDVADILGNSPDVVLGRSEASLDGYLHRLEGKHLVKVVCMDLDSFTGRSAQTLPQCADRGRSFPRYPARQSSLPRLLARSGSGPAQRIAVYLPDAPPPPQPHSRSAPAPVSLSGTTSGSGGDLPLQTKALYLLLEKRLNRKRCRKLAPRLLRMIAELRRAGFAPLVQLGNTLHSWKEESPLCGASPATTPSPKASTPKWKSSSARPMASETSTITGSGLRYCVLGISRRQACPH